MESGTPSVKDLIAKVQELADQPAEDGHPLEWAVPAYYLGDMSAVAIATLRSAP